MRAFSAITIPAIIAETVLAGRRAFELYKRSAPPIGKKSLSCTVWNLCPHAQMIAGRDVVNFGQAKTPGSQGPRLEHAAISQAILGIKPDFDGLRIDPCIPPQWDGFQIQREFRGAVYSIQVKNPNHVSKGVAQIRVDGREIAGNLLPLFTEGVHEVEVILG